MDYYFGKYPADQQTITSIQQILNDNPNANRIVLQFPKIYLAESFNLTKHLRKIFSSTQKGQHATKQFYTLFDSMKKQCCTDIIGAEHIDYEILIHFGQACFSEELSQKHFYLFPPLSKQLQTHMNNEFGNEKFIQSLKTNRIKYLLTEQKLYRYAKQFLSQKLKQNNIQLLKLPFDAQEKDEYLIFGYYAALQNGQTNQLNNILVVLSEHPEKDNKFLSDIHLTAGSFSANKKLFQSTPEIFVASLQLPLIQKSNVNYAKPLMNRLAQIGELQKYDTFGLLVSNASTYFCRKMIQKCKVLLQSHHKKYFIFMMNNLNQVKLGNFPEIEVYVVISCYNNSCFSMKDFCRLVVTPMDLQVAFNNVSIGNYNFDLNHPTNLESESMTNHEEHNQEKTDQINTQKSKALSVQQKQQIMLANNLQTLDHYRSKQYKGLDFAEKKQVEKIKKGKIGLAQQYKPLPAEETQF